MNGNNVVRIGNLLNEDDIREALDRAIDTAKEDGYEVFSGAVIILQNKNGDATYVYRTSNVLSLLGALESLKHELLRDD